MNMKKLMGIKFPNIRVLGDTSKLESGSADPEAFAKARLHGLDGSIWPFATGASESPIIMKGNNGYNTISNLQYEKENPGVVTWANAVDREKKRMFMRGHLMEEPIAMICASKMEENLGVKVEYIPCKAEFVNNNYPNVLVHMDGFFHIEGDGLYLNESKSTLPSFKRDGKATKADLVMEGICPEDWAIQIACVQGVIGDDLNLKGTFLTCGMGMNTEKDFVYIKLDRNPDLERMVVEKCQKFVDDTADGIVYTEKDDNASYDLEIQNLFRIYAEGSEDEVKLGKNMAMTFQTLDELEREKADLTAQRKELLGSLGDKLTSIDKRLDTIKKSQAQIEGTFIRAVGDGQVGIYSDKNGDRKVYLQRGDFSFDASVKEWLRTKYPEVWDELKAIKPKIKVKIV